jgi:hypothetical protein
MDAVRNIHAVRRGRAVVLVILALVLIAALSWIAIDNFKGGGGSGRGTFSYAVDTQLALHLSHPSEGQPPLPLVTVVRDPHGHTYSFSADEIVLRPHNGRELSAFLTKYAGTVLRDGSLHAATKPGKPAPPSGAYLIRVDVRRLNLDGLARSMERAHITGHYLFSSLDGARLVALVARERQALSISLNPQMHPMEVINETQILEGMQSNGTTFNYAEQPYTTATLDLSKQELGIGVIRAWDYLAYKGIPLGRKSWRRPILAIIDGGFALDTKTGRPLNQNLDFGEGVTPVQLNEDTDIAAADRHNAGGTNPSPCEGSTSCPYHGTGVFSVAAAFPRNHFGSAGTGAEIVKPYLIRVHSFFGFQVAQGITDAVLLQPPADVINLSLGIGTCGTFCGTFYDGAFTSMQGAVNFARGYNSAVVVAAAGNDSEGDNNRLDNPPCTLNGVLCVGAISFNARREAYTGGFSGTGSRVSIWAPDCITTTPDPATGGQLQQFCGTSASSPFVAGIVALMKALDPSLNYDTTRQILRSTALKSPDPAVTPGYVNAFGAVTAVSPNQAPTIAIRSPVAGATVLYGHSVDLTSSVSDPEQSDFNPTPRVDGVTVTWSSNIDGLLCTGIVCISKPLSLGVHTITATVTDPYGAKASASVQIRAVSGPPSAVISYPSDNSTFFSSQQINLRGYGWSPNVAISDAQLEWSSSAVGVLGTGRSVWVSLPVGPQTITLTAKDSIGQTSTASIHINVQSGADYPTVRIIQPAVDYSFFGLGSVIVLQGIGTDPIDGILPGTSLNWASDIDGPLGHGNQISVRLSGGFCAPSYHHITLTGTNTVGHQASITITVIVGQIC